MVHKDKAIIRIAVSKYMEQLGRKSGVKLFFEFSRLQIVSMSPFYLFWFTKHKITVLIQENVQTTPKILINPHNLGVFPIMLIL